MWYVGYLERKGKPYIFAMNFITDDYEKTRNVRQEISKAVFDRMKLLD
jgi:beta-lactamase class D